MPSPAGLVVKKGLNIFSFTSGGMPVPLSRIVISTRSPRFFVVHGGSTLSLIAVFGLSLSDLIEEFLQHLASFWPRLPL